MKRAALFALITLAAGAAAATAAGRHGATPNASRCGGTLWRLKTLSDPGRNSVALTPTGTTIGAILSKPFPNPVPTRRRTAFQRQAWEVVAQITRFKLEEAGIRLELYDHNAYVNAVIPTPTCLTRKSRARAEIRAAWNFFGTRCPRPTREWQSFGAILYVRGVGFWSQRHPEVRGTAPNGAELYPVTGFRIVAGCR
jgi:hypothetical protein